MLFQISNHQVSKNPNLRNKAAKLRCQLCRFYPLQLPNKSSPLLLFWLNYFTSNANTTLLLV